MSISLVKPTVGGSESTWGLTINTGLDTIADALNGTAGTVAPNLSTLTLNGTDVTATAAELNTLDGVTATAAELNTASTHYVPTGGIILWSGSIEAIPTGWLLCDGENSTPDLQDRFVVGAGDTYDVDGTGDGTLQLTEANLPAHNHTATSTSTSTVTDPGHDHNAKVENATPSAASGGTRYPLGTGPAYYPTDTATTGITVSTSTTTTINNTGSGTAINIVPKYYALAYIMKA